MIGVNNQNFIMEDEETGSWWQQVSGRAVLGPLKGKQLELISSDEVALGIWNLEHPETLVLLNSANVRMASADWDADTSRMPAVPEGLGSGELDPRAIVIGITVDGKDKAYPLSMLIEQNPVTDRLGSTELSLVVARDGKSVRGFSRRLDGEVLDLFLQPGEETVLVDSQSGSEWDFTGTATRGPHLGRQLERIPVLKDYWFDWKLYHADGTVFSAGKVPGSG